MAKTQLRYVIGANISEAEKAFKSIGNSIDRTGKKLTSFGKAGSAALTVPLTALLGMSTKVALQVDDALDDIRIGTGATGEALKALEADFKSIATAVPQDFGSSAKAIADFNTLTGASGKQLQEMSVAALDAARMMKTDLGGVIGNTGKLMNNWKVPVDQAVDLMDKLFVASQSTGMGMDAIAASATRSGTALRQMGFSVDESLALVAKLDKEGIQADQVLKSLNRALATLAKEGITNTSQAFGQIINSIRNAKTDSEATSKAMEIFGSRAGPELAIAIREGRFEIEDLVKSLGSAGGAIKQTARDTDGFTEQWGRLTNEMGMALEPLGTKILSMAEKEMPHLSEAIKNFSLDIDEGTIKTIAFAAAVGPATIALGGFVGSLATIAKTTGSLIGLLSGSGGLIVGVGLLTTGAIKLQEWLDRVAGKAAKSREEIEDLARATEIATQRINQSLASNPNNIFNINSYGQAYEHAVSDADLNQAKAEREKRRKLAEDIAKVEAQEQAKRQSQTMKLPVSLLPARGSVVGDFDYSKLGSGKSGPTAAEKFAESTRDRMKYLKADGQSFLSQIEAMQAKLKPLTDDWKVLEDLKIDIDQGSFDKALQEIQDRIRYLGEDGTKFLPDLEKMKAQFDPLSEKGKQVRDQLRGISEEMYGKKWSGYAWEFSEGLLKAGDYAKLLQAELAKVTQGTEEWKSRFSELQNLKATEAENMLNSLSRQFESGKLQNAEYESALAGIISQYEAFPRAAQIAADALEMFRQQNELTTASLGTQLSSALKDTTKDFNELGGKGVLGVVDGFLQASIHGDDFGASLKRLGEDIVYTTLKMIILQQLTKMLGGAFGMGGGGATSFMGSSAGGMGIPGLGGFTFADGGVFENGRVTPFARGGVVSSPTVFPMANGMGLMGEAGAEAVMPLARDPQGRLGVRTAGGGQAPNVSVHVENRTSTSVTADDVSIKYDDFERMVVGIVLKDQASNGPISRNFRG